MEIPIQIQNLLKEINSKEDLLKLFREIIGFKAPAISETPFDVDKKNIKEAEIIAEFGPTKVFYLNLLFPFEDSFADERKIRKIERQIISKLQSSFQRQNLFVFSDLNKNYWDFIYPVKYGPRLVLKRFTIRPDNRDKLRTLSIQFSNLTVEPGEENQIYKKLEETFSVEAVSEHFFKDYEEVFNATKEALQKQSSEHERIHRFVHQLLNRLMFLYFVQRRGVFNGDKHFLANFWNAYRNNFEGKNEFYDKWLKVLFFEALNRKFFSPRDYFKISKELNLNSVLQLAPYLNGGLFWEDPEVDYLNIKLSDNLFIKIFDFLESYNFTARENTPLDEDLEIDPEMLGNIYEAMVNVSEIPSEDERHKAGIFYTPKTEIDLMIRRSLVEFLFNKTKIDKLKLYQFVFPETEDEVMPKFNRQEAERIYHILDKITIVDPACGSGHYLVSALQILFDLKKELWSQMGNSEESFKSFEEKRKIIENSIFGVDIKEWAAEIAKLRLWLDLMVSAEDEQLQPGSEALLPNLAFKIRVGDSLVQEIGGIFFGAKEIQGVPRSLIALKKQLVDAKRAYFRGEKGVTEPMVKSKEIQFFTAIIDEKINELKGEIQRIEAPLYQSFKEQLKLLTLGKKEAEQLKLELTKKEKEQINQLKQQITHLQEERKKISMDRKYAFWPIEFAEVLSGENGEGGFDIVIANPPYVRQEMIEDPQKPNDKVAAKQYKEKLLKQIQLDWNDEKGNLIKISQRADLYVYFYLKGLQLLNPDGVMCFISSNSWLDVGFGAGLQEILLKRVPILAIYDNQTKRSFKHADVNTIIALFGAPKKRDWLSEIKENKIKFVMFRKPFEEVCFSDILWQIEEAKEERLLNENFRLVQKDQWSLYLEGIEEKEETQQKLTKEMGNYVGNKWGGKYLRAPEIYWTILEKGKNKMCRLNDLATIKAGIITGNNEKYYKKRTKDFDADEYSLVFRSPREVNKIYLNSKDAVSIIKIKRVPFEIKRAKLLWVDLRGDKHICHYNANCLPFEHNFYGIDSKETGKDKVVCSILNSSLVYFLIEVLGRRGLGGGAIRLVKIDLLNLPILKISNDKKIIKVFSKISRREVRSIFEEFGINPNKPIREQEPKPLPDRAELDKIIFSELGLTEEERKEVYWAVAELVQNRLRKAKSV